MSNLSSRAAAAASAGRDARDRPRRSVGRRRSGAQRVGRTLAHARDERPRAAAGVLPAAAGVAAVAFGVGSRRTHRRGRGAGIESVRRRRVAPDRPRTVVGEGCRDRAVRHGRQGRAARRHRPRARGRRRRRRGARGATTAVGPRARRTHRRGRGGGRGDARERDDARRRAVGRRGDRRGARAAVPRAAAFGRPRAARRRAAVARRGPAGSTDASFLGWAGGAAVLGALAAAGGYALQAGTRAVTAIRDAITLPAPATTATVPASAELGIDGLTPRDHPERRVLPHRHGARGARGRPGDVEPAHPRHGRQRGHAHAGMSCSRSPSTRA